MAFVLDASVVVAWLFQEDALRDPAMAGPLRAIQEDHALVPGIWATEVANALNAGERRGRATGAEVAAFVEQLRVLDIVEDDAPMMHPFEALLGLARRFAVTVYDAAYLELAMREGIPLATLDRALERAARQAGVALLD